jgi:hypothetical protein
MKKPIREARIRINDTTSAEDLQALEPEPWEQDIQLEDGPGHVIPNDSMIWFRPHGDPPDEEPNKDTVDTEETSLSSMAYKNCAHLGFGIRTSVSLERLAPNPPENGLSK